MKKAMILGLALVAAATLTACSSDKTAEAKTVEGKPMTVAMVNTKCPYTGGPVNADVTSEFKGQKVGFCCAGCKGKFDKATDADKTAKLASMTK